jgi:hypothetical protein
MDKSRTSILSKGGLAAHNFHPLAPGEHSTLPQSLRAYPVSPVCTGQTGWTHYSPDQMVRAVTHAPVEILFMLCLYTLFIHIQRVA